MTDALDALKSAVDTIRTLDFDYGCWNPAQVLAALRERGFDVVSISEDKVEREMGRVVHEYLDQVQGNFMTEEAAKALQRKILEHMMEANKAAERELRHLLDAARDADAGHGTDCSGLSGEEFLKVFVNQEG